MRAWRSIDCNKAQRLLLLIRHSPQTPPRNRPGMWLELGGCGISVTPTAALPPLARADNGRIGSERVFSLGRGTNRHPSAFVKRRTRGRGMSPREFIAFYRWCAAYCLEVAPKFEDPGCKAVLFRMARTWRALADRVERAADATHDIVHPQSDQP